MSDKREPPGTETTSAPTSRGDAPAPSLDAIRAKLGAIRKSLDAAPPAPPPLPTASNPVGPPRIPPSAPASASAPAPEPARDTGETRDTPPATEPAFEVPFTLLRPKTSEPATPSTDPGRSLGTAPGPPPPPPITDETTAYDAGAPGKSTRRPWVVSLLAMVPVTGFLCFLAYYAGNARLRGERISDARETIQTARAAADKVYREVQTLATRIKRTVGGSIDQRTKRWTRIDWNEWEAVRTTARPFALTDVIGAKRVDRLGGVAVRLMFEFQAAVVEHHHTATAAATALLSRRADLEKALADPEGATASAAPQKYAVVIKDGNPAVSLGEIVAVRRSLRGAAGADGAKIEVVRLVGSHEKPIAVAEEDLVTISRGDIVRRGPELWRAFTEQVARLEQLALGVDHVFQALTTELDRLSK